MGVRHYKELFAWQTGQAFKLEVYRLVGSSKGASRNFRYRDQILDAARGVPASIVEGFRRCSPGDFARFLDYSIASLAEAEEDLHDGIRLDYFPAAECQPAFKLAFRCNRACVRLKQSQIRYLNDLRERRRTKPRRLARS
ncbi:MAG TPA: four helix bundle protein [Vicinamibacterales bacterium]|nr:four helix bundle protein [Vicinamibacterales bacterium]